MGLVVAGITPCPSVALLAKWPQPVTMEGWIGVGVILIPLWLASLVWVHRHSQRLAGASAAARQRWNLVALLIPLLGAVIYWACCPKRRRRVSSPEAEPTAEVPAEPTAHRPWLRSSPREVVELFAPDGKPFAPHSRRGVWAGWDLVREIISDAVHHYVPELEVESIRRSCRIRGRYDQTSRELRALSFSDGQLFIAALKHMAGLPLIQTGPSAGRFRGRAKRGEFDVVVRTGTDTRGESLRIELRFASDSRCTLDDLGVPAALQTELRHVTAYSTGLILVAGPQPLTQTVINALMTSMAPNLLETEEPTRPVRAEEITETALMRRLVATPLTASTATEALVRWVELHGEHAAVIPPLQLVVALRPVVWLCDECRAPYRPEPAEWQMVGAPPHQQMAFRKVGCPACHHTGYRGEGAIWEWMVTDKNLQRTILEVAAPTELLPRINLKPWQQFRADAIEKVLRGRVSLADAARALTTDLSHV